MKIYLIGLPGSGKSLLGKKLAKRLNYEFVDTDSLIEQNACMFIDEIFNAYGEEYFRDLETNTLLELKDKDNLIISTGGGIIKNKKNKEAMDGICIYIDVPLKIIEERLNKSPIARPLLKEKTIYDLYEERIDLYNYFLDEKVTNIDINKAVEEVLKIICEK